MKQLLTALCLLISMATYAQRDYDVLKDDMTGGLIFKGMCKPMDLNTEKSFDWYRDGFKSYKPDPVSMIFLKQYLKSYSITVFMGTWCDDSHNLVPKLIKVLDDAHYDPELLTIFGVDREKTTRGDVQKGYNITLVPTIIVLKNDKEVGRITEMVKENVETDLAAIVQKDVVMGKN